MDAQEQMRRTMVETGALREGHFKLVSGLHSPRYFQCGFLLQDPKAAHAVLDALAQGFHGDAVDYVVGIEETGSILAFETAQRLRARMLFARRQGDAIVLMEGFKVGSSDRVLVVDDVTTTGGTAQKLLALISRYGATPVGVALVATKGLVSLEFGCKTRVLVELRDMPVFSADTCSLCKRGIPLTD